MAKVIAYSKKCLPCQFDDWYMVVDWCRAHGLSLAIRRTEYNPIWHQMAVSIYDSEMYAPFITNGTNYITVEYALEKIKNKEDDDLLQLLAPKKSTRKARVATTRKKTRKTTKKKAKE